MIRTARDVGRRRSSWGSSKYPRHGTEAALFRAVLSLLFTWTAATGALLSRSALFQRRISDGHALCVSAVMLKILHRLKILRRAATSVEPGPTFASDAEIELAAQIRHQLEERFFEPSPEPLSPQSRPDKKQ